MQVYRQVSPADKCLQFRTADGIMRIALSYLHVYASPILVTGDGLHSRKHMPKAETLKDSAYQAYNHSAYQVYNNSAYQGYNHSAYHTCIITLHTRPIITPGRVRSGEVEITARNRPPPRRERGHVHVLCPTNEGTK